jgi:hypothetical protein
VKLRSHQAVKVHTILFARGNGEQQVAVVYVSWVYVYGSPEAAVNCNQEGRSQPHAGDVCGGAT